MNDRAVCLVVSIVLVVVLWTSAHAWPPDRRDTEVKPSISTNSRSVEAEMSWGYLCYSYRTGAPRGCTILNHTLRTVQDSVSFGIKNAGCIYDFDGTIVPDTCGDGGHEHSSTASVQRPQSRIYTPPNNSAARQFNRNQPIAAQMPLEYEAPDLDPGTKFNVAGPFIPNDWVLVKYPTPDNAGSFYWQAQIEPPPCYFLAFLCGFVGPGAQDNGTSIWDGTVNVGFDGLAQLPTSTDLYIKFRNPPNGDDPRHPDRFAFAGTTRALTAMQILAFQYKLKTNKLLRPNDLSLPRGGLFDVTALYQYAGGHASHREGLDIDLNRAVLRLSDGVEELVQCENDLELFEVVNQVLMPVPGRIPRSGKGGMMSTSGTLPPKATALLCEKNPPSDPNPSLFGRKHIDITTINFPPFIP